MLSCNQKLCGHPNEVQKQAQALFYLMLHLMGQIKKNLIHETKLTLYVHLMLAIIHTRT
jgi:hypothetical protein